METGSHPARIKGEQLVLFPLNCQFPPASCAGFLIALFLVEGASACTESATVDEELGQKVHRIQEAIANPGGTDSLQAVTDLGHDSRYYTLVRGWLAYQLKGDYTIIKSSDPGSRPEIEERIRFLEEAIRAIDLE